MYEERLEHAPRKVKRPKQCDDERGCCRLLGGYHACECEQRSRVGEGAMYPWRHSPILHYLTPNVGPKLIG
jgi:hypothetical protein